jgi:putative ABC transport system permease protein
MRIKEQCRESLGLRLLDEGRQDLRYAFTSFRRSPGFAAVAIVTLGLGIGANTAMFSAVDSVLIKPLPFPHPDRLVSVRETDLRTNGSTSVSSGNFMDWKDHVQALESVAGWRFEYFNIAGRDEPEQIQGYRIAASYLPLLGARTAKGRLFLSEEEQPGHERVAVLTDALWRRRFGSAPDLVGQTIQVDGQPFTVVGILSATFPIGRVLNRPIDIYVPLTPDADPLGRRSHDLNVNARLKPGVTIAQAQAQLDEAYRNLAQAYPDTNAALGARVFSVSDAVRRASRPLLLLWMAAVGAVLLMACANIASLLLARAVARQKEMALRAALGANRARLIRQLLTEGLALALLGGAAGTLAAVWGVHALNRVVPFDVISSMGKSIFDGRVFAFTTVLSIVCGLAFGFAPVWQSGGRTLSETLETASRGMAIDDRRTRHASRLFVVAQLALALVLSSGALLLVRSAAILQGMSRGLNLNNVLTMQIWLPRARYPDGLHTARLFHDVVQRVEQVAGVESASVINFPPLAAQDTGVALRVEGDTAASPDEQIHARYSVIGPQYFRTMQIPVLSGRPFNEGDADEARGVAIVSASMAHRFWRNDNPIGRRIQPQFTGQQHFWDADFKNLPLTIVGVVGDVRDDGPALQGRDDVPLFYLPYQQNPASLMHLAIRTRSNPLDVAPAVRRAVWAVDKNQPVFDTKSMEDVVAETFGQPRVMAGLTGTFASAALLLAALGVYGLLSYVVNQRTREIGIRMALGARPQDVLRAIVQEGAYLGLVGVAVGLAASFGLTRLIAGFLFGVGATDPLTFAGVSVLLFGVTLTACLVPAWRAMRVDPLVALRCE